MTPRSRCLAYAAPAAAAAALALAPVACGGGGEAGARTEGLGATRSAPGTAATAPVPAGPASAARVTTVATGLDVPWGIAFLPDGDALVGERDTGRILRIPGRAGRPARAGRPRAVMRIPAAGGSGGEGGLLGLAVSPHYARDRLVYAYYTAAADNRIVRFRLGGRLRPIVTGLRKGAIHDGGRIAFGPDGKLYAGVGETGDAGLAQDPASRNGKILRMNPDGSAPAGNPRRGSLVWSSGHRNVQGLAWDTRGRLWASEFGQNRFDEVNLVRAGDNGGWPVVEGVGPTRGGRFVNPEVTWPTAAASPSGAAIVGRTLYLGALQGRAVLRVRLRGTRATKLPPLLRGRYGRIRTVVRAPDGALWVTTSNRDGRGSPRAGDDRILRLGV
jgi:glucose/arabinose dehydrogenase